MERIHPSSPRLKDILTLENCHFTDFPKEAYFFIGKREQLTGPLKINENRMLDPILLNGKHCYFFAMASTPSLRMMKGDFSNNSLMSVGPVIGLTINDIRNIESLLMRLKLEDLSGKFCFSYRTDDFSFIIRSFNPPEKESFLLEVYDSLRGRKYHRIADPKDRIGKIYHLARGHEIDFEKMQSILELIRRTANNFV